MSAPFTPDQEARVREIAAEMIGQALRGADRRLHRQLAGEDAVSRARETLRRQMLGEESAPAPMSQPGIARRISGWLSLRRHKPWVDPIGRGA